MWEKSEKKMLEDLEKIQSEMEKYLEAIMDEKLKKTLEINQKYEGELRDLEIDLDLSILNNRHTKILFIKNFYPYDFIINL